MAILLGRLEPKAQASYCFCARDFYYFYYSSRQIFSKTISRTDMVQVLLGLSTSRDARNVTKSCNLVLV